MPAVEFSETQFSFQFTFEFISQYAPWTKLPIFPSTGLEGKEGYGYDVAIDSSLFLQYKVPYFVTRRRLENSNQWNKFNHSFYRYKIDTSKYQFELLQNLLKVSSDVYYVAPEFHTIKENYVHYTNKKIVMNSNLVNVGYILPITKGEHSMIYAKGGSNNYLLSDPIEIKTTNVTDILNRITNNKKRKEINAEAKSISEIIFDSLSFKEDKSKIEIDPISIFNVLLSYYNILWLPLKVKK